MLRVSGAGGGQSVSAYESIKVGKTEKQTHTTKIFNFNSIDLAKNSPLNQNLLSVPVIGNLDCSLGDYLIHLTGSS